MIVAFRDTNIDTNGNSEGVRVILHRNENILEDMEEVASVIRSFRDALRSEVPEDVADLMITTVGKLAYVDDAEGATKALEEFDSFLENEAKNLGIDIDAVMDGME